MNDIVMRRLLETAVEYGVDVAMQQYEAETCEEYEGRCDALQAEREDAHGDYAERGAETARDDFANCDSRGRSLRPAVNDAGEPWWM